MAGVSTQESRCLRITYLDAASPDGTRLNWRLSWRFAWEAERAIERPQSGGFVLDGRVPDIGVAARIPLSRGVGLGWRRQGG